MITVRVSNPCLSSPRSYSRRKNAFSGIPAFFTQSGWRTQWKRRSCLLVGAGREPDPPGGKLPIQALPETDYKTETGQAKKNAWRKEGGKENRLKKKKKRGDVERREGIANCRVDRKLAKMTTTLTAALEQWAKTKSNYTFSVNWLSFLKTALTVMYLSMCFCIALSNNMAIWRDVQKTLEAQDTYEGFKKEQSLINIRKLK